MSAVSLRLVAPSTLIDLVAPAIAGPGLALVPAPGAVGRVVLRHRVAPLAPALRAVVQALHPIPIPLEHAPSLSGDAELCLGLPADLGRVKLRVRCPDAAVAGALASAARGLGFETVRVSDPPDHIAEASIRYGAACAVSRGLVAWIALRAGCALPSFEKAFGDGDGDLWLDTPVPGAESLPARSLIPVTLRADSPAVFAAFLPRLREQGFLRLRTAALNPDGGSRVRLDTGAFGATEAHIDIGALTGVCAAAFGELGIDCATHPLELAEQRETADGAVIEVPAAAIAAGSLPPYSRFHPSRYALVLRCDEIRARRGLTEACRHAGFNVETHGIDKLADGFFIRFGTKVPAAVVDQVRHAVEAQLEGAAEPVDLALQRGDGDRIEVQLPLAALRSGALRAEHASPARHMIKVISPSRTAAKRVVEALKGWGCTKVQTEISSDASAGGIKHGCARPELLDRLERLVGELFGRKVELAREKAWPDSDKDIYLVLPSTITLPEETAPEPEAMELPIFLRRAPAPRPAAPAPKPSMKRPQRAFIEETATSLRIGDTVLPRRAGPSHPLVPRLAGFAGFCVDQAVAGTLGFVARAVVGGHAAALEGPTAASKTWSLSYLAARLGVPVYRLNLSGSSDASELVGRFVPDENRAGAFRWQDGPAPAALREGAWLLVDEANLAPSEILERMNPLLDRPDARLVLTEADGRIVEAAPGFSVHATWNGRAYAGRQTLSPAFEDRFKIRLVQAPDEAAYVALGECLVLGHQPVVEVDGSAWLGGMGRPSMPELARLVPEFPRLLVALARFQAGLSAMAEAGELRTGGRMAVTRRAFVDALGEMRRQLLAGSPDRAGMMRAVWNAVCFTHLDRLDPAAERPKATSLLAACGITATGWELPQ